MTLLVTYRGAYTRIHKIFDIKPRGSSPKLDPIHPNGFDDQHFLVEEIIKFAKQYFIAKFKGFHTRNPIDSFIFLQKAIIISRFDLQKIVIILGTHENNKYSTKLF